MRRNVPKVDVEIVDFPDALPCLFDVTEPHRQMKPIENMGDRLPRCADHDALQTDVSIAEDRDVTARHPSLGPQRRSNNIVFAGSNMR